MKKIITVVLTSGVDVMGVLVSHNTDGSVTVQCPQQYSVLSNQFIPLAATAKLEHRILRIPKHSILTHADPLAIFDNAYRETFPEMFVDDSALVEETKARIDQIDSPVHGNKEKSSLIIS